MTRAKELLEQATPPPWRFSEDGDQYFHGPDDAENYGTKLNWDTEGLGGTWRNDADPALIVYAVNHLPDYEAAADILAAFMELPGYHGEGCYLRTPGLTSCDCGVQQGRIAAKAALARLRDEVAP